MRKPNNLRTDNTISLGDALKEVLQKNGSHQKLKEAEVVAFLKDVFSPGILASIPKLYIKEKVLYMHIVSAPLRHEMTMLKPRVLKQISTKVGPDVITDLVILGA